MIFFLSLVFAILVFELFYWFVVFEHVYIVFKINKILLLHILSSIYMFIIITNPKLSQHLNYCTYLYTVYIIVHSKKMCSKRFMLLQIQYKKNETFYGLLIYNNI